MDPRFWVRTLRPHPEHRILRAALIVSAFLGGVLAIVLLAWLFL